MMDLLHQDPELAERFVAHLLSRNIRMEEDLVDQLFNSSEKRLARLLLLLANFGKESKPVPVIAKMSQETLAEMIGTTRSRVSCGYNLGKLARERGLSPTPPGFVGEQTFFGGRRCPSAGIPPGRHESRHTALLTTKLKESRPYGRKHIGKCGRSGRGIIHQLSRATSAMAEAVDKGVAVIKRAVKRSSDAGEELVDDTTQRIKRHPVEATAAMFAMGVIVGGFIGWMISRR